MFDANMRHLPKDYEFFASCHGSKKGTNFTMGEVYLCKMLDTDNKNPSIEITNDKGELVVMINNKHSYDKLFIYEGHKDGTDFINDKIKQKAMKLLEVIK